MLYDDKQRLFGFVDLSLKKVELLKLQIRG